ncbi:MAG: CbiX/SirB N-terminal domain-containing protein [Pirellulales bacterium]
MNETSLQLRTDQCPPGLGDGSIGLIIVDHGSRREASNLGLLDIVQQFRLATGFTNVEAAHMELAEPSIASAFAKVVARGATTVVIHPYFLLPGRHWETDIPRLAADAARHHPHVRYLVTSPLGIHPLMHQIILDRIAYCWQHAQTLVDECDVCRGSGRCVLSPAGQSDQGNASDGRDAGEHGD